MTETFVLKQEFTPKKTFDRMVAKTLKEGISLDERLCEARPHGPYGVSARVTGADYTAHVIFSRESELPGATLNIYYSGPRSRRDIMFSIADAITGKYGMAGRDPARDDR